MSHDELVIPHCDILFHCGDLTYTGSVNELIKVSRWFNNLKISNTVKDIVFIAGNHDRLFESGNSLAKSLFDPSIIYLQDEMKEVQGIKIYGSPRTPFFCNWAFNEERGPEIRDWWDQIPECDILLTHGPPYNILDLCDNGWVGCEDLLEAVKRVKPKIHAFGHIHQQNGIKEEFGIKFINCAVMDNQYNLIYDPIDVIYE